MKKKEKNIIKFLLNQKIYPPEAIYGAAYVFLDRAYIFLDTRSAGKIEVSLKGKKNLSQKQLEDLRGEFLNELLNYTIRINLAKYNKKIREYIVSQALLAGIGQSSASEEEISYQDDPLGIAIPWEEKYNLESKSEDKNREKK